MPNKLPFGLSADHLCFKEFEPQRRNNFNLIIAGVTNYGNEHVTKSLNSCSFPVIGVKDEIFNFGNEKRYAAGTATCSSMTLKLNCLMDTENPSLTARGVEELVRWRRAVYNPETGIIGNPLDYKQDCTLEWISPTGNSKRQWLCIGVWPSSLSPGNFDYNNAGVLEVSATLEVDKVIYLGEVGKEKDESSDFAPNPPPEHMEYPNPPPASPNQGSPTVPRCYVDQNVRRAKQEEFRRRKEFIHGRR